MAEQHEIVGIMVALLVDGEQTLFLMLGADGSINRIGNGSVDHIERQMFIGMTDPGLFRELRSRVGPGVLHWVGQSMTAAHKEGTACELTVQFRWADGSEGASVWRYGSESRGPHPDVSELVTAAVEATDSWFEKQKAMVADNG